MVSSMVRKVEHDQRLISSFGRTAKKRTGRLNQTEPKFADSRGQGGWQKAVVAPLQSHFPIQLLLGQLDSWSRLGGGDDFIHDVIDNNRGFKIGQCGIGPILATDECLPFIGV